MLLLLGLFSITSWATGTAVRARIRSDVDGRHG